MSTVQLPSSNAISEATPDSLSELFSRDPEHFQDQDIDKIIATLRDQRARYQLAESTGAKVPKPIKAPEPIPVTSSKSLRI